MNGFPCIFVITGPSGVGKSTLLEQVMSCIGHDITFSVSSTTRDPRPGEEDGVDYNFTTPEKFRELIDNENLIEWAEVFGNFYGTPWKALDEPLNRGRSVVLDLDIQGHRAIRNSPCEAVHIFIAPPQNSLGELKYRLEKRGESVQNITRRMLEAPEILAAAHEYDITIVNDDEQTAVFALLGYMLAHMNGLL